MVPVCNVSVRKVFYAVNCKNLSDEKEREREKSNKRESDAQNSKLLCQKVQTRSFHLLEI